MIGICSRMKISSKDILKLRKLKLKQVSCSEHIEKIGEGKKFLSCDSRHVSLLFSGLFTDGRLPPLQTFIKFDTAENL